MAGLEDWKRAAAKEVKDRDLDWATPEDITVKPLCMAEDVAGIDPGLPDFSPFTRGVRASMSAGRPWAIRQYAGFRAGGSFSAIEREVNVVGASSLAAGHKTLIPELIQRPREAGGVDIDVVAGGVIPAQDYALLRPAGVAEIFGPGTNLVDAGGRVLRLLGHNMPPADDEAA